MTEIRTMPVDHIQENPRAQVRARTNPWTVKEYAEAMQNGAVFPPIIVFQEAGCETYVVADGHHRLKAAVSAGLPEIEVDLREGDETAALEFALQSNAEHGLRLNADDRRHMVSQLMSNPTLTDRYRTHEERADLLRISPRHFQRLLAEWRESEGGNSEERAAKKAAKESAEQHTSERNLTNVRSEDDDPPPPGPDTVKRESSPFTRQQQSNLNDVNTAIEGLAHAAFTADYMVQTFGADRISSKWRRALEFLQELEAELG